VSTIISNSPVSKRYFMRKSRAWLRENIVFLEAGLRFDGVWVGRKFKLADASKDALANEAIRQHRLLP
jgi:hypothetical protein